MKITDYRETAKRIFIVLAVLAIPVIVLRMINNVFLPGIEHRIVAVVIMAGILTYILQKGQKAEKVAENIYAGLMVIALISLIIMQLIPPIHSETAIFYIISVGVFVGIVTISTKTAQSSNNALKTQNKHI